jgi:hypothetical protein
MELTLPLRIEIRLFERLNRILDSLRIETSPNLKREILRILSLSKNIYT